MKIQCLKATSDALKEGKSVLIDRCNLEREQRADFVKLGSTLHVDVHAVALDLPAKVCISRAVSRKGHEGNLYPACIELRYSRVHDLIL